MNPSLAFYCHREVPKTPSVRVPGLHPGWRGADASVDGPLHSGDGVFVCSLATFFCAPFCFYCRFFRVLVTCVLLEPSFSWSYISLGFGTRGLESCWGMEVLEGPCGFLLRCPSKPPIFRVFGTPPPSFAAANCFGVKNLKKREARIPPDSLQQLNLNSPAKQG